jgi:NAD(P)-dependent dehydrogenase (short-subunit alcohol dehydrogenase family)
MASSTGTVSSGAAMRVTSTHSETAVKIGRPNWYKLQRIGPQHKARVVRIGFAMSLSKRGMSWLGWEKLGDAIHARCIAGRMGWTGQSSWLIKPGHGGRVGRRVVKTGSVANPLLGNGEKRETTFVNLTTAGIFFPPFPGMGAYVSSKMAAVKLLQAFGAENPHVRIHHVHPGFLDTAMSAQLSKTTKLPFSFDDSNPHSS